jgi:hypothetical protein
MVSYAFDFLIRKHIVVKIIFKPEIDNLVNAFNLILYKPIYLRPGKRETERPHAIYLSISKMASQAI